MNNSKRITLFRHQLSTSLSTPFHRAYDLLFGKQPVVDSRWLFAQVFLTGMRNPFRLFRHLNLRNLRTLFRALRTEDPLYTLHNIQSLIGSTLSAPPDPDSGEKDTHIVPEPHFKDLKSLKASFTKEKKQALRQFLKQGSSLVFPPCEAPQVSILLVLFNRAELTLACLQSVKQTINLGYELIVVDNASSDETSELMGKIGGITYVRNGDNLGFLKACSQAANLAKGKNLLFLNNDTQLLEGSLFAAWETLEEKEHIGAVGGKITLLDGSLQEAGSIIWKDASCLGYGRGHDPQDPVFNFRRPVDYCSGAFLLTPKKLYEELGGFDETFAPAYYEESDYCLRLWEKGYQVVYEPRAELIHYEFGSAETSKWSTKLQAKNQLKLVRKHRILLGNHFSANRKDIVKARFAHASQNPHILFLDDRVPHVDLGSGFPRSNQIIHQLVEMGYQVTILPLNFTEKESWEEVYRDLPREVEVMSGYGQSHFRAFLADRAGYYDYLWVSRPQNMRLIKSLYPMIQAHLGSAKIIYDAEAIFANRALSKDRLQGLVDAEANFQKALQKEMELAKLADEILCVNESEAEQFRTSGFNKVQILNAHFDSDLTQAGFSERSDLLFVGNLDFDQSPNVDSLVWLVEEVFPFLPDHKDLKLHIVGSHKSAKINKLAEGNEKLILHGQVKDLKPFFEQARLFVAPTRFAAGSPAKVLQAMAYGLPTVTTELIAGQLGLHQDFQTAIAPESDARLFAQALLSVYSNDSTWEGIRSASVDFLSKTRDDQKAVLDSLLLKKDKLRVSSRPIRPASQHSPILVTGAHRSGSTWTGKMLALAENAYYLHEPFNVGLNEGTPFEHWFQFVSSDMSEEEQQPYLDYVRAEIDALPAPNWNPVYYNGRKRKFNKNSTCILKDPIAVYSAEWVAQRFHAQVVQCVRHPAAFVASLKAKGWKFNFNELLRQPALIEKWLGEYEEEIRHFSQKPQDIILQGILLWNMIYSTVSKYRDAHPDWIFVRHEDLSREPLEEFRKLYQLLGLEFSSRVQAEIRKSTQSKVETEYHRNSNQNISSWKHRLTEKEISLVREGTQKVAACFYSEEDW